MRIRGLLYSYLRVTTFRRLFNWLLLRLSYFISRTLKKPIHWGMPATISIEPTTSCNLGCTQCPSGLKQFSRPTGNMSLETFRKIIDDIAPNLAHLTLYFQGEPYMNPHFFHFVEYAREKRIFTLTSSNGHFLSESNCAKTVNSGLDKLIISMDGTDQESYEHYRVGGNLQKVISGVRNLIAARKKAGSLTPFIELQFIVFSSNEHQIPAIKKIAAELGVDKLSLKTAQIYDFEDGHALIPGNEKYARYRKSADGHYHIKSKLPDHCWKMWQGNVVSWDGRVVPCCYDKDAAHQLGNLNMNTMRDVWKGEPYRQFRSSLWRARKDIDICSNCSEGLKV